MRALFLLAAMTAVVFGVDDIDRFVVKWNNRTAYIVVDHHTQNARVAQYEAGKLAVFYSGRCVQRQENNAIVVVALGEVVWGPEAKTWLSDSFFIVPETRGGFVYDEGHIEQKVSVVSREGWHASDISCFEGMLSGVPKQMLDP